MTRGQQANRRTGAIQDPFHIVVVVVVVPRTRSRRPCFLFSHEDFDEAHMFTSLLHFAVSEKDLHGLEHAQALFHPGGYLHKTVGPKYKADIQTLYSKAKYLQVRFLFVLGSPSQPLADNICRRHEHNLSETWTNS